jgi:hypothetical protein
LFDAKIIEVDSPVKDNHLNFTYFIKGMANISGDVVVRFWLSKDETFISSGHDTIYLGNFEEKTESTKIFLPKNLSSGSYDFNIEVSFENYKATSHRVIQVEYDEGTQETLVNLVGKIQKDDGKRPNIFLIVATVAIILLILIFIINYFRMKVGSGYFEDEIDSTEYNFPKEYDSTKVKKSEFTRSNKDIFEKYVDNVNDSEFVIKPPLP